MPIPPVIVDALVFDAYGTLFDVHSVEATAERLFPAHGAALSQLWRTKQLEYTWLQSLMLSAHQRREDFAAHHCARARLSRPKNWVCRSRRPRAIACSTRIWTSQPFPDAEPALARLAPLPRVVLSNGTQ